MEPIYTPDNTTVAYQLNWSLALFGRTTLPGSSVWLNALKEATESDGVRILSTTSRSENTIQFLLSTRPQTSPCEIVRCVKGRLQYLLREQIPKAFRRNYHISSTGNVACDVLDRYVACQTEKHPMADATVQMRFQELQFHDPAIDLSSPSPSTHGQFLNAMQVVVRYSGNWNEVCQEQLLRVRDVIVKAARTKAWRLSRVGLLCNHMHVLLGAGVTESPQAVALSMMNNIAFVYNMKPVLQFSYYAGTFGGYDRRATLTREHSKSLH